ncbi:hypothetical protein, partial [Paraprevotella clara]|uniref:hypothetical protein n=1 Tax=Paraprevotella clara TaxID=454154 RepID=UPI00307B8B74
SEIGGDRAVSGLSGLPFLGMGKEVRPWGADPPQGGKRDVPPVPESVGWEHRNGKDLPNGRGKHEVEPHVRQSPLYIKRKKNEGKNVERKTRIYEG